MLYPCWSRGAGGNSCSACHAVLCPVYFWSSLSVSVCSSLVVRRPPQQERALINMKRQAKRLPKNVKVPVGANGSSLALALRIKGTSAVPLEVKKVLNSLRLSKINQAVFVHLDKQVCGKSGDRCNRSLAPVDCFTHHPCRVVNCVCPELRAADARLPFRNFWVRRVRFPNVIGRTTLVVSHTPVDNRCRRIGSLQNAGREDGAGADFQAWLWAREEAACTTDG